MKEMTLWVVVVKVLEAVVMMPFEKVIRNGGVDMGLERPTRMVLRR